MSLVVKIQGIDRLAAKLDKLPSTISINLNKEITDIVTAMDADVKETINRGSRSGRVYKRGKITHTASAAGEPPKTDRGQLVQSFFFDVKKTLEGVVGKLYNTAAHAKHLEFKPVSDGGRPYMRPLFDRWEDKIIERLTHNIQSSIEDTKRG